MKPIIYSILVLLITLLAFAFAAWDINPGNWSREMRAASILFGLTIAIYVFIFTESKKNK